MSDDKLVSLHEAATDLLNARDRDERTVGYRTDLWSCLRAVLADEQSERASMEGEIEALREGYQNAVFALELWEREANCWLGTRVPEARPGWIRRARERGMEEMKRHDALTSSKTGDE